METVKVDIQKLQLLNDRIAQTIDALNHVRLSVQVNQQSSGATGFVPSYGTYGTQGQPGFTGQPTFTGQPGFSGLGHTGQVSHTGQLGYTGQPGYTGQIGYTGQFGYTGQPMFSGYMGQPTFTGPLGYTTGPTFQPGYSPYAVNPFTQAQYAGIQHTTPQATGWTMPQSTGWTMPQQTGWALPWSPNGISHSSWTPTTWLRGW